MDLNVYECGKQVGSLHMEKTGLYQTVSCTCQPVTEGVQRVFVWDGTEGACLGVLCPEGLDFTLHKRVSRAALPFAPTQAVLGCEDDGFWPWRGEFDGAWIDDGYLQKTPNGDVLAVPFSEGMEYPFVHRLTQTEQRVICSRDCIVLGPENETEPEQAETLPPEPEQAEALPPEPKPKPEPETEPEPKAETETKPESAPEPEISEGQANPDPNMDAEPLENEEFAEIPLADIPTPQCTAEYPDTDLLPDPPVPNTRFHPPMDP